ncbi:hypothetical protein Q5P01_004484 [Channa striata]|uniref:Ig-like domain-containing protein n=1 Tax=Channa striata TaxID=64152 RepID=A0AA88NHT0_CHASR|nr:hypothetical protein Q5P01_004484 [Channa striata]
MTGAGYSLVPFFVLLWILTLTSPCVFMQSCVLLCSFQGGSDVVVHWILTGDLHVHSYYHNQDQLGNQDQTFRGRTSLFKEQISGGNASLQLTGVRVQDQHRYRCHTSTERGSRNSYVSLKVDAPVRKIHIEQVGNRITCSSEGIYPKPELTWSMDPPSSSKNTTTVHQTEQQLYNISSSLILSDPVPDVIYSCRISTRTNTRRTTLRNTASLTAWSSETSVPCSASNTSLTDFSLIWRFNHSQTILIQTRTHVPGTVSEDWRKHVRSVSESGSLVLQGLSSDQEGTYTCELSNNQETYVSNTVLIIEKGRGTGVILGAVVGVVVVVLVVAVAAPVLYFTRRTTQTGAGPVVSFILCSK